MSSELVFDLDENDFGIRLDRIVSLKMDNCSLRKSRRLIRNGWVRVGGKIRNCAYRPYQAQKLAVVIHQTDKFFNVPVLLGEKGDYSFFFKPSGMHTAHIAGAGNQTLEDWIELSFGKRYLLQRLDYETCGIVCTTLFQNAAERFKKWEAEGKCIKFYLCLLAGKFEKPVSVRSMLKTDNRRKTGLCRNAGNSIRQTEFFPLPGLKSPAEKPTSSWVAARIFRGHRHQIRVHAASIGFPLVNDNLYGNGDGNFFLRNFYIEFPGIKEVFLDEVPGAFPLPCGAKELLENFPENYESAFR